MIRVVLSLTLCSSLVASAASAQSASALWPTASGGNGHLYEIIGAPGGITWDQAQQAAINNGGYLVTLTSAAENDFVFDNLVNDPTFWQVGAGFTSGPWIGGFQPTGAIEPSGGFEWTNGEGLLASTYTNWRAGEPNNTNGTEDRAHFFGDTVPFNGWNDAAGNALIPSYIVEYPIPEPSTGVLVLAGAVLVTRRHRGQAPRTSGCADEAGQ